MNAQNKLSDWAEQRVRKRKRLHVPAMLLGLDARCRSVDIIDVSVDGLCMRSALPLQTRNTCAIAFDSPIELATKRINVWAKVAYCLKLDDGNYRIGVRFLDYDSYSKMHIDLICK